MTRQSALDDAKTAWAKAYAALPQAEVDRRVRGFSALVRGIAQAGVVRPAEFARQAGVDAQRAKELFAALANVGVELDAAGNVVGAALTSRPTPHVLRVAGQKLYAWCALDTLFIPGLLGESAEVESVCGATGEAIRLDVSAGGVRSYTPRDAVLSVFLPGASGPQTGPASPT